MEIRNSTNFDLVLIGHFAFDRIITKKYTSKEISLGGGVTYGTLAASIFDPSAKIGIISKVGKDFNQNNFSIFQNHNIDLSGVVQQGKKTTQYMLKYSNHKRKLQLLSKAPDFELSDLPNNFLKTKAIHLTPIANEFTHKFLENLAFHEETQDTLIGIDIQGIIREFDKDGYIKKKNGRDKHVQIFNILKKFGKRMFLKASDDEAIYITRENDLIKATEILGETGAYIFTTLGEKGLYFKAPNHPIVHINAYNPKKSINETGAGDCFMAVLLLQLGKIPLKYRTYSKIIQVAKIASAAASFLIEEKGPFGFRNKTEIEKRVKTGDEITWD